jgi:nanoRNase/pAp phosphatase (c-di-AMP/oligoRNAs hydrolase)
MLSYGGGGHANAGTCQVAHDDADRVLDELVGHLNAATRTSV